MPSTKFGDLLKKAKEAGAIGDIIIPDGDFLLEIIKTNCKDAQDGPIGLFLQVIGDEEGLSLPDDDKAKDAKSWLNLYFTEAAAGISFRQLKQLGFTEESLAESESAESIADAAQGIQFVASVGHRPWGKDRVSNTLNIKSVAVGPPLAFADEGDEEPF